MLKTLFHEKLCKPISHLKCFKEKTLFVKKIKWQTIKIIFFLKQTGPITDNINGLKY
jgi:hypothetical protein